MGRFLENSKNRGLASEKRAFALFTTLTLMAILVFLLVTLTGNTRTSLQVSPVEQSEARARSNALLSLQLAVAQLQLAAVDDQRVTARRDILGSGEDNPFWTGVWESRNIGGGPVWLVTEGPGVVNAASSENFQIVGNPSSNELVQTPMALIQDPVTGDETGAFAWWTSDESIKANVKAFFDPEENDSIHLTGTTPNAVRRQISTAVAIDKDFNELIGQDLITMGEPTFASDIEKTVNSGQLPIPLSNGNPLGIEASREQLRERFFDYTVYSVSTLTNNWDGGLRQDLTHLRRLGAGASQSDIQAAFSNPNYSDWPFLTQGLAEFVNFGPVNTGNIVTPQASDNYFTDPVGFKIAPVITEFFMIGDFIVRSFGGGISDELVFFYYVATELFNPYTQRLRLANDTGRFPDDPGDIRLRISGWPYLVVRNVTQDRVNVLEMPEILTIANSFNDHDAGFGRFNFSPTNNPAAQYNGINTQGGVVPLNVGFLGYTPNTWDVFEIEFVRDVSGLPEGAGLPSTEGEPVIVEFFEYFTNDTTPVLLQRFELTNWEDGADGPVQLVYPANVGVNYSRLVNGVSAMGRNSGNRRLNLEGTTFGIHLQPVDEWNDATAFHDNLQPLDNFLGIVDFRQRVIEIDMQNPEEGDGLFWQAYQPTEVSTTERNSNLDFFYGIEFGSAALSRNARMIDLPRGEVVSISALNNLHFNGFPYKPLGNTFNGDSSGEIATFAPSFNTSEHFSLNQKFDRFFFSSLPVDVSELTSDDDFKRLPNGWIKRNTRIDRDNSMLASANSAEQLLVKGGFNVNSTSVAAWRAQLLNQFPFLEIETVAGANFQESANSWRSVTFGNPFNPLYNVGDVAGSQLDLFNRNFKDPNFTSRQHHAFRQGFRELAREGSFDLTQDLAEAIVERIQSRGQPFASIAEFADSGVLQDAIDSVEGINTLGGRRIPTRAPAYVSAGDILGQLSPRLFARSDTFTIRFYGEDRESISPVGSSPPRASVKGEAVIQRYPGINGGPATFEIESIRWITKES